MSCSNRLNQGQNWNQNFNTQQYNPSQNATPRRAASQNASAPYGQIKPQRLSYSNDQYLPPQQYQPNYNQRQYGGHNAQANMQQNYECTFNQQTATPQRNHIYSKKVIYETTNMGPPQANYSCGQQAGNYGNQAHPAPPPPSPQTNPRQQYMESMYFNLPQSNSYNNYADQDCVSQGCGANCSRNKKPPPQKPCATDCTGSVCQDQIKQLFIEYMIYLEGLITKALIRRKRMRECMEKTIKWTQEDLDCREKRSQKRGKTQLEDNLHQEVNVIYNDLMNRRKQLYHEAKSARSSLVSINARRNKDLFYPSSLQKADMEDDEKHLAEQFIKVISDAINSYLSRDIELQDEFNSLTANDADSDTMSFYHQEYQKETGQLEEDFINLWERFENEKCTCGQDDDGEEEENEVDPMLIEIGNTLQEVLLRQFKLQESLEKKLADECTDCMSPRAAKNFPNSDRQEVSKINVELINDFWDSIDTVKTLMSDEESTANSENYMVFFRVILAIYRRGIAQIKEMLQKHYKKRRAHQVENLSSIFDDEWSNLREDIQEEVQTIIDSLKRNSSTNMNCQERRLQKQQNAEKEKLVQQYQSNGRGENSSSQRNRQSNKLRKELEALEKSHNEQWATILLEKMQRKVDEIESIYPKESKEACVQVPQEKLQTEMESIDESIECHCTEDLVDAHRSSKPGRTSSSTGQTKSESEIHNEAKNCSRSSKSSKSSKIPDMSHLEAMEVNEMKELQKNLRQWQMARRHLMESINESFKQ